MFGLSIALILLIAGVFMALFGWLDGDRPRSIVAGSILIVGFILFCVALQSFFA